MSDRDDLKIESVELTDFRSYHAFSLSPASGLTVIVGPNASGKTNLLEAIRLVTSGSSFRNPKTEDLVRKGAPAARVVMAAGSREGSVLETVMTVTDKGRTITLNGKVIRRRADIARRLPSVVFTPDDLLVIKGSADGRRDAIDEIGESLSSAYGALKKEYGRSLRQRNSLLKEKTASPQELEPWTEMIASIGGKLVAHRVALLRRVAGHAESVYGEIAGGEPLHIRYVDSYGIGESGWAEGPSPEVVESAIRNTLTTRAADERRRGATLAGPHRDDLSFEIAGAEARARASQGQQRTAALAWKIAELRVVQEVTGHRPVLLLDDVMSELDEKRRAALTTHVGEGLQTFITATTLDYFEAPLLAEAEIVRTAELKPNGGLRP